jgi:platelet-activating factor acetylhydrolase
MPISPLLSGSLPSFTPGPHKNIGYRYLSTNALFPFTIPSPIHKETNAPVLDVNGVSYAIFYPGQKPTSKGGHGKMAWLPEPTSEMFNGYEKFTGKSGAAVRMMRLAIGRLKIPIHLNAPLEERAETWPLALFSHGIAGTRTTYTQYASALASQGYVVLVVEHRDGSGPAVVLPKDKRVMLYVKQDDLLWEEEERSLEHFRALQLEIRVREMFEVYHSFRKIIEGVNMGVMGLEEGRFASWRQKVDTSKVDLIGHSFGGATAVSPREVDTTDF